MSTPKTAALGVTLALSGCVPYGAPPLDASLGAAGRRIKTEAPRSASAHGILAKNAPPADAVFQMRLGFHPFRLGEGELYRRIDLSVGYSFDTGIAGPVHGAYLEGAVNPIVIRLREGHSDGMGYVSDDVLRVGVAGQVRVADSPGITRLGRGAALDLFVHYVRFTDGCGETKSDPDKNRRWSFLCAQGEWGIGAYAEASMTSFDVPSSRVSVTTLGGGLSLVLPLSLGFVSVLP